MVISPNDLRIVLALIVRSTTAIADIPSVWPVVQKIEQAAKSGFHFGEILTADQHVPEDVTVSQKPPSA